MKHRRKIETVISQLTERFNIQKILAKDLWHFTHRFTRKILAHTACVILNQLLSNPPLQLDLLVKS